MYIPQSQIDIGPAVLHRPSEDGTLSDTPQGPLYWGTSDTPSVDGCQLVSHFGRL